MSDRLFHYYYEGIKEPIKIKAANKELARQILDRSPLPAEYKGKTIIGETTSQLIIGISHQIINGKKAFWNGVTYQVPE